MAQLVERNVDAPGMWPSANSRGVRNVEEEGPILRGAIDDRLNVDLGMVVPQQSGGDETGHVDRIFCRTVLRRIRQFGLFENVDAQASLNRDGQHIDSLVDPAPPTACAPRICRRRERTTA